MLKDLSGYVFAFRSKIRRAPPARESGIKSRSAGQQALTRLCLGEEGSNLVELAMVLPILAMLLTALLTFSMVMYTKEQLQQAVSQGVRMVAISQNFVSDPCGAATTVMQNATQLNSAQMTITFLNGGPNGTPMSGTGCAALKSGTVVSAEAQYPCSYATILYFTGTCTQLTAIETQPVP